jgi:eukaryotic-like serine/threonine-protein kinase
MRQRMSNLGVASPVNFLGIACKNHKGDNVQEEQVSLPAGTVISRRYVVKSLLGKDDSSATYLVEDQRTRSELFALKEVRLQSKHELSRFLLACQWLTRLDHQSLVHVYALLKDDKHHRAYVLMEHIEGPDLETLLQQQPEQRFSWPEAMNTMAPVIDAVCYLHRQQPPNIHGNINPTTIIVPKARGRALLIGLDTAQEYDSDATKTAVRSHSSSYRAPAQHGIDVQADIYGLGAVFYTLITGIVPADALSRLAHMDNEGNDPLKPVNEMVATVPAHVAEAIERAMSLDAQEHFSSAEQLWEALWAVEPSSGARRMPFVSSRPPLAAKQAVIRPATVSAPKQPRASHAWKLAVLLIVLVVLIGPGVSADSLSHVLTRSANPTAKHRLASPTPTVSSPTPIPTSEPIVLRGTYKGTIYDIPAKVRTSLTLTQVQQKQGKISGILAVGPGLLGFGPFSGTIDTTTKHLRFTVRDDAGNPTLFFEGAIQSAPSLSGDYYRCIPIQENPCHKTTVGYGIWNVLLSS